MAAITLVASLAAGNASAERPANLAGGRVRINP
jgi:hypothetical protein